VRVLRTNTPYLQLRESKHTERERRIVKVEIWSDIPCPWCYIGRRRFENALRQFEHRDQVEVTWRSFQLDPHAPAASSGTVRDELMQKYRTGREQVDAMLAQATAVGAKEGLDLRFDRVRPANSYDAHRLLHLAAERGLQAALKERLQKAHFTEGALISDHDTLVRLAVEAGLDADEARRVLETDAYGDAVQADIHQAQQLGIHGVPFFVLDRKYGVSGAQSSELFLSALERAWAEAQPAAQATGSTPD
jgi:predicted DsbA family dithiol-disulfide isomerase